jgi:hypothetical protein
MKKIKNCTVFYTEKFNEYLCQCDGLISLNVGDKFINENGVYEITWKLFNVEDMIMIYHGKFVAG